MAEDTQTVTAISKLVSDPLPTTSTTSSTTFSNTSILNLAATYNKLHLGTNIKPPDINASATTTTEDYNNNTIDSGLGKVFSSGNHGNGGVHDPLGDNYANPFMSSVDGLSCSEKWSTFRSDSPFPSNSGSGGNMMSPHQATASNGQGLPKSSPTTSGGNNGSSMTSATHQALLSSQLMAGHLMSNRHPSMGSVSSKCSSNGGLVGSSSGLKKGENCMIHAMPNTLWCLKCHTLICRACAGSDEHRNHNVKTQAKEAIRTEIATELVTMQRTLIEVQHLVLKQRDFLLKILESCSNLKSQIENDLINHEPTLDVAELRDSFCRTKLCLSVLDQAAATTSTATSNNGGLIGTTNGQNGSNAASPTTPTSPTPIELYKLYTGLNAEKQRLHQKYQDLYLQCKFDDLLRNSGQVVDYETISRAMQTLHISNDHGSGVNSGPLLLMANYCLTQIYARQSSKSSSVTLNSLGAGTGNHSFSSHSMDGTFPFLDASSVRASQSPGLTQLATSAFGGTKSPFLDLAVGNPTSSLSSASHLQHHTSPYSQAQAHSTTATATAASQLIGSSFSHQFNDNLLLSNSFQTSNHHPGISSALSTLRHSGTATSSSNAATAGGISFEMNGISVPISMLSSQKFHSGIQASANISQHHPHHHHLLHSATLSSSSSNSSGSNSIICNPTVHIYPIYYFNVEINGQPCGRILIEVRNDVAPRMAKNFGALASGELGFGYKGCHIFQCWENESIITGDFELNNGRGGRSVFEDGFFMPDDTKILAIRGSVGMRRSQKRHDNMGLVGSQFRIILREMRGFTGIFAFVIEGLELVEKISQTGDSAGKPQSSVVIVSCGKLQ